VTIETDPQAAPEGQAINPQPERPRTKDVILGDQVVVLHRLGTRDGLAVAHSILRHISKLRGPIEAAVSQGQALQAEAAEREGENRDRTEDYVRVGLDILDALMAQLDERELLRLLSRLLGQDEQLVGDAPLEDVMNAVADALSINDLPAFMRAASRIVQEAQRIASSL